MKAVASGTVKYAGDVKGYGNTVIITHDDEWDGYESLYAHLDSMEVSSGQRIEKDEEIGISGNTGDSTGAHLHFERQAPLDAHAFGVDRIDGQAGADDPGQARQPVHRHRAIGLHLLDRRDLLLRILHQGIADTHAEAAAGLTVMALAFADFGR